MQLGSLGSTHLPEEVRMTTTFTAKWKPEKAAKKLATARPALLPGEDVLFLGVCNNMKPLVSELALTALRVLALQDGNIKFEARYSEVGSFVPDHKKGTVEVVRLDGGCMTFKAVPTQ